MNVAVFGAFSGSLYGKYRCYLRLLGRLEFCLNRLGNALEVDRSIYVNATTRAFVTRRCRSLKSEIFMDFELIFFNFLTLTPVFA